MDNKRRVVTGALLLLLVGGFAFVMARGGPRAANPAVHPRPSPTQTIESPSSNFQHPEGATLPGR